MNEVQVPVTTKRKVRVGSRVGSGTLKNYVCIRKGADVKRLKRNVADAMVRNQGFSYCDRSVWKKEVRDVKGYVAPVAEVIEQPKKKAKKVKTDKARKSKEEVTK
jgi:DNA modification methylase